MMQSKVVFTIMVLLALVAGIYAGEHPISPRMIKAKELRDAKLKREHNETSHQRRRREANQNLDQ